MTPSPTTRGLGSSFAVFVAIAAFLLAGLGIIVNDGPSAPAASAASERVAVELSDFAITPKAMTAAAGTVTMNITNTGAVAHNVSIASLNFVSADLAPGASATVEIPNVAAGSYEVLCAIPGHAAAGMTATLTVGDAAPAAAAASMPGMGMSTDSSGDATIDFSAAPGSEFTPREPNAPAPLAGTVHNITFETSENVLEVAPGVTQQMWTFNEPGQAPAVPGPVLRGNLGDTFNVTVVNRGAVDHSIDFHASKVAWNDEMRSIKPGESLVYSFTADYAGAFMYHCGTAPALHHIGNGMYGAIIINPPTLAPVDHEFVIVQSELYLGPQGQPGDLAKMKSGDYDAVVFNGYANQYKFSPIRVEPDDRVRVWVVDAGPNADSSFHVVGTIFDTVYKEGSYLLQPDTRRGGSQVLDLQPAQGGFVEFSLAEKGLYPMVTHKFNDVGVGALGLFQAGDVPPAPMAGH
jgi:nitrite reductase (NO-forming)